MPYLDKDAILNSLTKEDVIKICAEMGSPVYKEDSQGNLLFSTAICHGGDSPHKLIYYTNNKMFHCFGKETKVITRQGLKTVQELCDKKCEILNGNGEWEETIFHNYGKQKLMKIILSCNGKYKELYATPEHEWLIHAYWYKKQTQELKKGMRLEKVLPVKINDIELDWEGIRHGFCYGDGTINSHSDKGINYTSVRFFTKEKKEIIKYYSNWNFRYDTINGEKVPCCSIATIENYKKIPDISKPVSYLMGFLAGYFAADGNEYNNRISIYSHKKEDLKKVQDICTKCGIASYHISKYDIKAGQRGCVNLTENKKAYNLHLVRSSIPDCFFITNKGKNSSSEQKGRLAWHVVEVEETNRIEDVYCCQTSTHSFALEDFILTGNCFTCGDTYGIVELVIRAKRQQGQNFSWYKALHFIAQTTGKIYESTPEENQNKTLITDFEWINRLNSIKKTTKNIPNLTEINENILDIFWYVPYQGWLDEHISREALSRFEIGYYGLTNQITIPHRDMNGRLIGIRGRYLSDYDAQTYGKYVPLFINGEFLSHQLGSNLYGLHVVKDKIKQCKKIMLVEAEKSVLQAYSYFRDDSFVVGLCGFNITFTQIKIMLKELKVEEVIVGFDRDYEEADSFEATAYYQKIIKQVAPLVPYCKVYLVLDKKDRLGYKDSPTDKGKDVLIELMKEKILITMEDVNEALGKT